MTCWRNQVSCFVDITHSGSPCVFQNKFSLFLCPSYFLWWELGPRALTRHGLDFLARKHHTQTWQSFMLPLPEYLQCLDVPVLVIPGLFSKFRTWQPDTCIAKFPVNCYLMVPLIGEPSLIQYFTHAKGDCPAIPPHWLPEVLLCHRAAPHRLELFGYPQIWSTGKTNVSFLLIAS